MIRYILVLALHSCSLLVCSQSYDYYFDNCDLNERDLESNSISAGSALSCECGLEGEAIQLQNQSLQLPLGFDTLFFEDWTLGFSIQINRKDRNLDILSKMHRCNADTSMYILFRSGDSLLICHFQERVSEFVELSAKLDFDKCWQQIIITKNKGTFRLFVNGVLKDQKITKDLIRLNNKAPIRFNGSPCTTNLFKTEGLLDNLFIRRGSINASQVLQELVLQDVILTQDTLVFLGADVPIRSVSTCATNIAWTPSASLDNPSVANPIARPSSETLYKVRFTKPNCTITDSVRVLVVDPNQIDCDKILFPTAFTPNQDGLNDDFGISNAYIVEKLESFNILDRNGAIVFSAMGVGDKWDGSFNNRELAAGKYFFRISYTCKGQSYHKQGAVFLLR